MKKSIRIFRRHQSRHRFSGPDSVVLLDGIIVCVLVIWMALGFRAGAAVQSIRLGAAATAFLAAAPLSGIVRKLMFGADVVSTPLREALSLCTAGVVVYIVCRIVGAIIVGAIRKAGSGRSWADRLGGAGLGVLKGLVASYFLVSVVYVATGAFKAVDPEDNLHVRDSYLLDAVEEYNVLVPWQLTSMGTLQEALAVGYIANHTDQWKVIYNHPRAAKFFRRVIAKRMLGDRELVRAAYRGEYAAVLADERARECLTFRPCRISLQAVNWTELRQKIQPPNEMNLPAMSE